jgi:predicted DNA-binding antitoxin AbrB/MazE fold protein
MIQAVDSQWCPIPGKEMLTMSQTVEAIYENGVLRLIRPLEGVAEHSTVKVTVETGQPPRHTLAGCIGTLSGEDASEMIHIIEDEFEKVNLDEWQ